MSLKFSIIISTYKRPNFLPELIESIFAQSFPPHEIIVVEGGDDASFNIVRTLLSYCLGRVKVVLLTNCSLGASRNYGVSLASGEWCVFSDDDDIWHHSKLLELSKFVHSFDVVSHAYHSCKDPCKDKFGSLPTRGRLIKRSSYSLFLHFTGNRYGGGSSISARTSSCSAIRFDEEMRSCEDIDWILRCLLAGSRMGFINIPLVIYRNHGNRMSGNQRKVIKWEIYMIRKFLFIPIGLVLGFCAKLFRVIARLILGR
jgi:glycosyltransferase involved in cell wall biosynthesis